MNLAHHLPPARKADVPAAVLFRRLIPVVSHGCLSTAVAASLQQRPGLTQGDRIALLLKNVSVFLALLYACWCAGPAAGSINTMPHPRSAAFILGNSAAAVAFATEDVRVRLMD